MKRLFDNYRIEAILLLAILCMAVLSITQGCAALGVPAADTFNKKLIAGYSTLTVAANSAATLRLAGKLSDARRDETVKSLRAAQTELDAIGALGGADLAAADKRLTVILAVLTGLQTALATQDQGSK